MIERLRAAGDDETARILGIILDEEVRHVAIGTRWFRHCCAERGQDPDRTFGELFSEYFGARTLGPCNVEARYAAGFSPGELAALQSGPGGNQAGEGDPGSEINPTAPRTLRDLQ